MCASPLNSSLAIRSVAIPSRAYLSRIFGRSFRLYPEQRPLRLVHLRPLRLVHLEATVVVTTFHGGIKVYLHYALNGILFFHIQEEADTNYTIKVNIYTFTAITKQS